MVEHLKAVAQRERRVRRMRGEELIIEPAAVAAAVPLRVKGETRHQHQRRLVVRPPRKSAVFGVLLLVFPLMALLFWMPEEGDTLLTICCVGAMLMGAFLLVTYFSVSIYYGEDGFLYKTLRGGKKEYRYKDIRGQRSVMTRGGINTILFVGKDEINLYSAMQNLNPFLKHAFFRWCEANGIDPDSIENNPRMFTWFPDPDGAKNGQDET